jgi:hypothetical protein
MSATARTAATQRAPWKAVAIPAEHGGWGLTLEPVLLGLLVAPSWAGGALGLAAFLAFLARTPAKLVVVDRRRDRWLDRSGLALRIAAGEVLAIAALAAAATALAGWHWWAAVAVAAPLVAVEWWFDVRSRSRRVVPELCGAIGVAGSTAAIVLAGDGSVALAAGAWLVLAARSIGAIPFVRAQIARARRGDTATRASDLAQVLSVTVAAAAVAAERRLAVGFAGVVLLAVLQTYWARHDPPAVKVLGIRQMALGIALVVVTAAGVWFT